MSYIYQIGPPAIQGPQARQADLGVQRLSPKGEHFHGLMGISVANIVLCCRKEPHDCWLPDESERNCANARNPSSKRQLPPTIHSLQSYSDLHQSPIIQYTLFYTSLISL